MSVHRYDLHLKADPRDPNFSGRVEVRLKHDGGPLVLNSLELGIDAVDVGGAPVPFRLVPAQQELRIDAVPAGEVVVGATFRGKISEHSLLGLYRTDNGKDPALVTQLEPLGARRVFPCVDHPAQKAEVHLSVEAPEGFQVLFNSPLKTARRSPNGGGTLHTFHPSPRMSTYLFFVGIGKFEERRVQHGPTEVIVATAPGKGDRAAFALEHAPKVLAFFERYFEVPYPLPKLHLIAVSNTAVGGMENWGAITFRERALLVRPDASQHTRRQALGTIAHEIAHQWFGDLVTMAWWNDIWLNESFATFMDYKAVNHLYPEWEVWSDFSLGTSNAQLWDALPHSHPVNVPVEDPDQISGLFDEISYAKGGAVLRMVEGYMGEEAFRKGVSRYLRRFAYGNARGEDLWAALDEEAGEPISPVLQAWVDRPGYPALRASRRGGQVELAQERFCLLPVDAPSVRSADTGPWPLPLLVATDGRTLRHRMVDPTWSFEVKDPSSLVVNRGRLAYTRVRYEGELGQQMRSRFRQWDPRDRWGLLQDTYAFLLAGGTDPATYLSLLEQLHGETDYLVASEAASQARNLLRILQDRPKYVGVVAPLIAAQSERLGTSPGAHETAREAVLRQDYSSLRVWTDPGFASTLAAHFGQLEKVDPSVKGSTAVAFARTGGAGAYDELLGRLERAVDDEEKTRFAMALGALHDPTALGKALALPFGGTLNPTLGLEILASALLNPDAREPLWAGLKQALPFLIQVFAGTGIVPLLLQWSVPLLGLEREEEMRSFFGGLDVGEGKSGLEKGFDLLRVYSGVRQAFSSG